MSITDFPVNPEFHRHLKEHWEKLVRGELPPYGDEYGVEEDEDEDEPG